MSRRDLRVVGTDEVIGAVEMTPVGPVFHRAAQEYFATTRRKLGDQAAAQLLLDEGWSNGYRYLGPVQP